MKKKLFLSFVLGVLFLNAGAKDFYEFDNVNANSVLQLFLKVKNDGRVYPTLEEFADIGISAADIEFIRSHVRRNELVNTDDRLNKDVSKDRKIFMVTPMGNGSQGAHGYPTNEMGRTDVWSMWNYTSNFGSWNHGFFQAPGSWADAAHKNGSKLMSGQMFFEKAFGGADDQPWVDFISKKNADGTYAYVEPMINALMYFGHDGIVYNWEANLYSNDEVIKFHKALYQEARKRGFLDYSSFIYTLSQNLNYYNGTQVYGTKDEPIHELFLNYMGGAITANASSSAQYAETNFGGADRLYAGVHIAQINDREWNNLKEDGAENINLAIWGEHTCNQIYNHTTGTTDLEWQSNYQTLQERFFCGGNNNPDNRPTQSPDNARYEDMLSTFCGMAEYMPERSAISKAFTTHFNLGNGEYYYFNGERVTDAGWYNMASQDIVPTYRWLVYNAGTTTANSALRPSFTHSDAFIGGSSLKLEGNAGAEGADVVLYKTQVRLGSSPVATVVTKRLGGSASLSLIVRVNGTWQEYPVESLNSEWTEARIALDRLGGGIIERIGFRTKGDADILVGKLQLTDDATAVPKSIREFISAESVSESLTDITLKLYWSVDAEADKYGRVYNDDCNIDHFEIFVRQDGEEVEVGRTTQWATVVSHIPFAETASTLEVGVRAVSTDLKTATPIVWREVAKGQPDEVIDPNDTSGQGPYYQLNFNKKAPHEREDRYVMHVGIYDNANEEGSFADGTLQQYPDNDLTARITKMFYLDKTEDIVFHVTAGKTYRPYLAYHGLWMSGYAYVDWNNDGTFNTTDGITFDESEVPSRTDMCEIVSYSAHSVTPAGSWYEIWYNSNGRSFTPRTDFPQDNNIKNWMGTFRVPENITPGIYRMRYKLDWNNFDAGGDKDIRTNGGDIVDVLINVHPANNEVKVGGEAENGKAILNSTLLRPDMNMTVEGNKAFSVTLEPNSGYQVAGVTTVYGYNLDSKEPYDKVGNRQWWTAREQVQSQDYTVPAERVFGSVSIRPVFISTTGVESAEVSQAELSDNDVYSLLGCLVRPAGSKAKLSSGVYVVKGRKVVVRQ